jgi:hypothetical protein
MSGSRVKKAQGGDHKSKGQNDTLINQAAALAKQVGRRSQNGSDF